MNADLIKEAIAQRRLLRFNYEFRSRTVEPHMLAYNEQSHLSLSAWQVAGFSKSGAKPDWREYLLSGMTSVEVLEDTFTGTRPGYKASGGEKFHSVQCAL